MKYSKHTMGLLAASIIASSSAFAEDTDLEVKLKGIFDFQAVNVNSNAPSENKTLTQNNKQNAFSSKAGLGLNVENTLDSGFKYGADLGVETTAKSTRGFQSMLYTESKIGRLELGSGKTAMSKIKITPGTIAAEPGGVWDVFVDADPKSSENNFIPYITDHSNFLDSKFRASGKVEFPRKITYYTPKFHGLQFGISYIPDSSNVGYTSIKDDNVKHDPSPTPTNYYYSVKDGIATAISYEMDITDSTSIKLAAGYETGKAKAEKKPEKKLIEGLKDDVIHNKNLKNYQVGTIVKFNDLSLAASYGNYQSSFASYKNEPKATKIYGFGASYKYGDLLTSITYFSSKHISNKVTATTIGADYNLAPGLKPYSEITFFDAKGRHIMKPEEKATKHSGNVFVLGTKLTF
jgi:hypothetical protein